MRKIFFTVLNISISSILIAQTIDKVWLPVDETKLKNVKERNIIPNKYITFKLNEKSFKTTLFSVPNEKNTLLNNSTAIIELPMPDGRFEKFRIVESPVMETSLNNSYPEIKTFNAKGIDDPYAYAKLDWTNFGFHAMIRKPSGDIFIDPYYKNSTENYISYYTSDFEKNQAEILPEVGLIESEFSIKQKKTSLNLKNVEAICAGANLRTYRLAIACTGEYAIAATGKVAPTTSEILSAVVTSVNRVDGVYETEVAVKMILVANETDILYASPSTDPFTGNNDAFTLIGESQTVIDNVIGNANYDIGHTFSTGGGGLANLGCVCVTGSKASGITGSSSPKGDAYDIDYVAHEMGHQFGGNHTFAANTGSCSGNSNSGTRVEPGSGVTIMAYAGICGATNDLAAHSIAYFHTISFDEIMAFTNSNSGNTCAVKTASGNSSPSVSTTTSYNVPKSTPFILTGSATDSDGDSLTYSWEEKDSGLKGDWNSGSKPYFRSYTPTSSKSRMFPKLSVVLSGTYTTTIGEYLPTTSQTLNFRLIARDNKLGGGGVCYAGTSVVIGSTGPFSVTYPNVTGIVWASGSTQTVTWNVNGTDGTPINCANVNILISLNGGTTFTTLLSNTPNDGTETITVPTQATTINTCRIKAESVGNIFFDINDKNFTISATTAGISELSSYNSIAMQLAPNPVQDELEIKLYGLDKNEISYLNVYDVLGNIVMKKEFSKTEQIDEYYNLSGLSSGIYFVEIVNTKQKAISRIVKQ